LAGPGSIAVPDIFGGAVLTAGGAVLMLGGGVFTTGGGVVTAGGGLAIGGRAMMVGLTAGVAGAGDDPLLDCAKTLAANALKTTTVVTIIFIGFAVSMFSSLS
jgi:hypothetical protein